MVAGGKLKEDIQGRIIERWRLSRGSEPCEHLEGEHQAEGGDRGSLDNMWNSV